MTVIATDIPDLYILEPKVLGDSRGWFMESWSATIMQEIGFDYDFVQDNHSFSVGKGILRGIHFQQSPYSQAKLVRCTKGAVLDVAIDLRKNSPTYKKWAAVELTAENRWQLLIPRGFGHGFLTLTNDSEFLYKADNPYNAAADRSIIWNDPELAINWGIEEPSLSEKDISAPLLKDSDCNYV